MYQTCIHIFDYVSCAVVVPRPTFISGRQSLFADPWMRTGTRLRKSRIDSSLIK